MASQSLITSKRGPPAPLSIPSSSEGEGSDHEDIPPSPCSSTASEPTYERLPGFTHHGQEVVASKPPKPRNVSTIKLKKRVKRYPVENGGTLPPQGTNHQREQERVPNAATNKVKTKKDPLPMKLRALPQSFWQQPNSVNTMSPGNMYLPVLPPLCKSEHSNVDPSEIRPISPSDEDVKKVQIEDHNYSTPESNQALKMSCLNNNNSNNVRDRNVDLVATEPTSTGKSPLSSPRDRGLFVTKETQDTSSPVVVRRKVHGHPGGRPSPRIVKVSPASQELLMKLFEGVDGGEKGAKKIPGTTSRPRKIRPRPDSKLPMTTTNKHLIKDQYMINAVTDGLLPMLSLETSKQSTAPSSQLSLVSLKAGDKTLTLPSLSVEQNYPAVLSELVKAL